jgi:V/A-type H+-transporting ATPase subunit A
LNDWYVKNVSGDWQSLVGEMMSILQEEEKLLEIVQLVGSDALPERQQVTLTIARLIREVLLQQNAFHDIDTYCDLKKTHAVMASISKISKMANTALDRGMRAEQILAMKSKDRLSEIKFVKSYENLLNEIMSSIEKELKQ